MSGQREPVWASYHIFYQGSGDWLLSRLVLPVLRDLWIRRHITRFFFIRYGLGGPHIRLRLLCTPEDRQVTGETLYQAAGEFFRQWPSETRLSDDEIRRQNRHFSSNDGTCAPDAVYPNNSVAELPFQPELERYGGPGLSPHSLDFFCVSSAYTLRLIEEHGGEARPHRLSHAMRAIFRQALGFAADEDKLSRLVAYAAVSSAPGKPLLIERAEQEFERRREDYVNLICEEVESGCDPEARARLADSLLTEAARALGWRIRNAAVPVWWQIVGSQLHMTSNRMDLMNLEEIYLGHILRRALEDAAQARSGLLPLLRNLAMEGPCRLAEDRLATLVETSLDQMVPPQEVEDER